MPRGGARTGAGRPKGVKSKAKPHNAICKEIKAIAQQYSAVALETLVDVCTNCDIPQARVAAATAILDRGWGKPPQAVAVRADANKDEKAETGDGASKEPERVPTYTEVIREAAARTAKEADEGSLPN